MMDRRRGGMRRKKVCQFCADKTEVIDYKDALKLRKYVSERSKNGAFVESVHRSAPYFSLRIDGITELNNN